MEFDFYRNFLVLAESNTMSAAARKLNIVQTASAILSRWCATAA